MALKFQGGTELIDPQALLARTGIQEGWSVAEFGCGTSGHLIFPAAHLVGPRGRIYAIDILKSALQAIASRGKLEGVDNVETVWADLERPGALKLAPGSVDLVILLHILALVRDKATLLKEAARILKAGGTLLIADWKASATPLGPPPEKRLTGATALPLAEVAGFQLTEEFAVGAYHWGMTLKKK